MRDGSEKPRIEADGWIHRQPVDPKEKQAKTVVNVCGFGLGILLCIFGVPELGLIVIGLTVLANVLDPLMDRSINMCPKCHTRRPYSRYQKVCAGCGYRPNPKKESDRGARNVYRLGADDAGSGPRSASHSHRRRG